MIEIALWSGPSFQNMLKRHAMTMKKYPNAEIGRDKPYCSIENLRPETSKTEVAPLMWLSSNSLSIWLILS